MQTEFNYISNLLYKFCTQETLTDAEQLDLDTWLGASAENREVLRKLQHPDRLQADLQLLSAMHSEVEHALLAFNAKMHSAEPFASTRRIHLPRNWRWAAAAILILVAGITAAVVVSNLRSDTVVKDELTISTGDILPGTNRAVLTVDDQKIDLSSDKTGISVGTSIAYTDGEILLEPGKMMTLTTPNGGQYQLVLPDGSKAWLNAASSISFPADFRLGKRAINITGEVYLEVAHDKSKPFVVNINGQSMVEVLGTSFNINAYGDEAAIKTTLVTGSVRMFRAGRNGTSAMLKPGQQATLTLTGTNAGTPGKDIHITTADLGQTLAWKNGIFDFNGLDVRAVMAQLSRWYDINVRYEGQVPSNKINGKMYRNERLSFVLEGLRDMGIKYKMEGRTLIVQ